MNEDRVAIRLRRLPRARVLGLEVALACRFDARLLGLAWLDLAEAGSGLLIPRCASVHTFGMRFPLDLIFLDSQGSPLETRRGIPRRRLISHRGAAAVLEVPSREGGEFSSPGT